jgi:GAF domain-containing protein
MPMSKDISVLEQQLKRKQIEMSSIQQIGKSLSSELRTTRLLPLIMQEVTRLMYAERSTFYIVDQERGELWSQIAQKAEIKEIRLKIGVGIAGHVAKTGEVINIRDAYQDERFDPSTDKKTGYRTRSILCMPIFEPVKGDKDKPAIIGVLQVLNRINGVFDEEDEELLSSMASQIAIAIINARLFASVEKKVSELNLLFDIEQQLSKAMVREQMLEWQVFKIVDSLNVESAFIALLEGDDDVFSKFIGHNMAKQFKEKLSELAYIPVISAAVSSGEIVVVNEFGENETDQLTFFVKNGMQVQHLVCAPLMAGDSAIGILMVFNKKQENDFFRKEDVQLIRSLSSQIARSLETYRLREEKQKAEHLASIGNMMSTIVHDLRTPIGNIQGFVELMQEESDPELRTEFAGIVFEQRRTPGNCQRGWFWI